MASRIRHKLNAAFVKTAPAGKYGDGGGLYLRKRDRGSGFWYFNYSFAGRRREMGLGSFLNTTLGEARDAAAKCRALLKDDKDPIAVKQARRVERSKAVQTLKDVAFKAFEARRSELKGKNREGRWLSPLEVHVFPKWGELPIEQISQRHIQQMLEPIWQNKVDTARKCFFRINITLKYAAAMGLEVDLQATMKARQLLGAQRHKVTHIPSLDWHDAPAYYAGLEEPSITNLAMRLLILTGHRVSPIRYARLDEIEGDLWTVVGDKLKGLLGKTPDFTIVLSTEAKRVIELAKPFALNGYLFPNTKGGVISDMTLSQKMKRAGLEARPHGFRSTLQNWAEEVHGADFRTAEKLLQHKIDGDETHQIAYRRHLSALLERRRPIYEAWGQFLTGRGVSI